MHSGCYQTQLYLCVSRPAGGGELELEVEHTRDTNTGAATHAAPGATAGNRTVRGVVAFNAALRSRKYEHGARNDASPPQAELLAPRSCVITILYWKTTLAELHKRFSGVLCKRCCCD